MAAQALPSRYDQAEVVDVYDDDANGLDLREVA